MTPRTREHVEGDLNAAKREVDRLRAELNALPPSTLALKSLTGRVEVSLGPCSHSPGARHLGLKYFGGPERGGNFSPESLKQLRDWLIAHFPVAA